MRRLGVAIVGHGDLTGVRENQSSANLQAHTRAGSGRIPGPEREEGRLRMIQTLRHAPILLLVAVALTSCASSNQMVSEWKDPSFSARPGQEIVVMAVAENEISGRIWETEMSKQLQARGFKAIAGSSLLGTTGTRPDSAAVAQKVADAGADLVFVTRVLAIDKESTYIPGNTYIAPGTYYGGYFGLFTHAYTAIETPGYIQQDTIVRLETSVFDVQTGRLVWGGVSESFNPSSTSSLAENMAQKIIRRLERSGVIPAPPSGSSG